jgi:hypothetical protein
MDPSVLERERPMSRETRGRGNSEILTRRGEERERMIEFGMIPWRYSREFSPLVHNFC